MLDGADVRHFGWDLRFGFRLLRRAPTYTAIAVATLALGIGATTAVFSVFNAVIARPLPYKDPTRLVLVRSMQTILPSARTKAPTRSSGLSLGASNSWRGCSATPVCPA
jgi:hypothetical protein